MSSVSTCKTRKERRSVARDEDACREESRTRRTKSMDRTRRTKSMDRGGVQPPLEMDCQSEMRNTKARDGECSWCIREFRKKETTIATKFLGYEPTGAHR